MAADLTHTRHRSRRECPYPWLPLDHKLNNEDLPRRAWLTRKWVALAAAAPLVAICVGLLTAFGLGPVFAGGADQPREPRDVLGDVYTKPTVSTAAHHPSVITAAEYDRKLGAALAAVQRRLERSEAALKEKVTVERDMLKAVDALLPLADDARADVDAVIRVAEDIRHELRFAEQQHLATAAFFRDRSTATATDEMRSINMQSAEWFDALARDVPRRQKLTDEFLADLARMRVEVTDTARTLGDLRAAILGTTAGPDPLPLSVEGRAFNRHVERFLTVIKKYYAAFASKAVVPPPLGGPTVSPPTPGTEK